MKNDLLGVVHKHCGWLFDVDLENKNPVNTDYDCVLGGGVALRTLS
jgi:hypothetical protein